MQELNEVEEPCAAKSEAGHVKTSAHETVLVVDDEDVVRGLLCDFLQRSRYPFLSASTADEAVEIYQQQRPSIVVTDICMPGMDGIDLLRAIHRDNPDAKVVVMTGYGDEAVAIEALRAGASNFIKKPIKLEEFLFIIQAHERLLRAQRRQKLPAMCLVEEARSLRLINDHNMIYAAAQGVTTGLAAFMPRHEIDGILLALTEALTNAIEHGNLGIGYEQKSAALRSNSYQKLLEERLADVNLSRRRIMLEYRLDQSQLWVRITDEGDGFDWSNSPDPRDPENMMREHGRGLSIMGLFTDEIGFNERGNQVWMIKHLKPENFDNTFAAAEG